MTVVETSHIVHTKLNARTHTKSTHTHTHTGAKPHLGLSACMGNDYIPRISTHATESVVSSLTLQYWAGCDWNWMNLHGLQSILKTNRKHCIHLPQYRLDHVYEFHRRLSQRPKSIWLNKLTAASFFVVTFFFAVSQSMFQRLWPRSMKFSILGQELDSVHIV